MGVVENLDVYTADFGVPVSFAGSPAGLLGILDFHDKHALGEDNTPYVIGRVYGVMLKTSVVDAMPASMGQPSAVGQPITVGGVGFIIRDPEASKDGAFSIVELRSAT